MADLDIWPKQKAKKKSRIFYDERSRCGCVLVVALGIILWGLVAFASLLLLGCALQVSKGDPLVPKTASFVEPTIRAADIWDAQEKEEGYRFSFSVPYNWFKAHP